METPLPYGWTQTTLGDALSWGSGGTPRATDPRFYGGEIPWVIIGDLNDGVVTTTASTITDAGLRESSAKWVGAGSILVAMYGSIGKLGIAGLPLTTNQAIAFTDPTPIEPRYLFWYLMSRRNDLFHAGKGGTQRNISQTVLKAFPFILAPLAEQRRIVAAVEEHLSRLDAAVAGLGRVKAMTTSYVAAVLSAACHGRLVATECDLKHGDGSRVESASDLVARLSALAQAFGPAQRAAVAEQDAGGSEELPSGWTWSILGRLGVLQGGIQKQPSRRPIRNKYPFLRVANVGRGKLDLSDVHEIELFEGELDRLRLEPGDLLIVEGNGSPSEIGRLAEWNGAISDCVHQNHLIRHRPFPGVLPKYLATYWNSPEGSARVLRVASSTSGLYTLSVSKVAKIEIPLPPTAEQERIVLEVERRMSLIADVQRDVEVALRRAARLRQSILKQAFEGELVPQDPHDEPATALLDRIRASRASITAKARKSRRSA